MSLDWFKGKFTGKPPILMVKPWFPVDFPLNQSNDNVLDVMVIIGLMMLQYPEGNPAGQRGQPGPWCPQSGLVPLQSIVLSKARGPGLDGCGGEWINGYGPTSKIYG